MDYYLISLRGLYHASDSYRPIKGTVATLSMQCRSDAANCGIFSRFTLN